jgi:hypothetical protein
MGIKGVFIGGEEDLHRELEASLHQLRASPTYSTYLS